jgi:hypothetical protein
VTSEALRFTCDADFDGGLGHAMKARGMKVVESRVFEHERLLFLTVLAESQRVLE